MIKCCKWKPSGQIVVGVCDPVTPNCERGYFVTEQELRACYHAGMVFQAQGGEFQFKEWLARELKQAALSELVAEGEDRGEYEIKSEAGEVK